MSTLIKPIFAMKGGNSDLGSRPGTDYLYIHDFNDCKNESMLPMIC